MAAVLLEELLSGYRGPSRGNRTVPLLVSIAGAGGKTSIHSQLVRDWKSHWDARLCIGTTTTKMFYPLDDGLYDHIMASAVPEGGIQGTCFLYRHLVEGTRKVSGLTPGEVDSLQRYEPSLIVCESDGARGMSIKAPGPGEPLHPASADIVIGIIGLSCLGKPCREETVHRMMRFEQLTDPSRNIGPETFLDLIRHPEGLFKGTPPGAYRVLVLNQGDVLTDLARDDLFDNLCGARLPVDAILLTSMRENFTLYRNYRSML